MKFDKIAYERRLRLKKSQSDQERNFHTILPPACPAGGAALKTQRTLRFCFLPNRNGRFDKAIGPSGVLENDYVSHSNMGCFFESSVPIRKRLCGLRDFAVQKTNNQMKFHMSAASG